MRHCCSSFLFFAVLLAVTGCDRSREGLVGWWKLDETAGVRAVDSSGNGNHASVRNGGWGEGRVGGALVMDGVDDGIVVIPLSESLRSTANAVTITAWAYRTADHNVDVLGHGYPALFLGFHGRQFKWEILNADGAYASCYADPAYRAKLDRWYHLAATYDGNAARLYVDGVEICRRKLHGPIMMRDEPFTISGYVSEEGAIVDEISGRIDDVRIFNRALGADEIRVIYEEAP